VKLFHTRSHWFDFVEKLAIALIVGQFVELGLLFSKAEEELDEER
jgi:hypothetical protein